MQALALWHGSAIDENGFWRVVNSDSVVLAQQCVREESQLFAAAPELLDACKAALSQLTEVRREYRQDDIRQLREAIANPGHPLKLYRVLVRENRLREAFVDAYDQEEARWRVEGLDVELNDVEAMGEWFVEDVQEVR